MHLSYPELAMVTEKTRLPSNTAGNRMITAFPSVRIRETIRNIEKMIVERAQTFDTIDYVYVVCQDGGLAWRDLDKGSSGHLKQRCQC